MNSADVFSLEFDMLTRTSSLAKILDRFRTSHLSPATHRQLLLELNHVINVHSRLREVAADVVPPDDWSSWQDLLAVPALAFEQGRSFLDDLRALGLNSLDSVSLTPLPQTIALAAYAHYQLVERATVGLVGLPVVLRAHAAARVSAVERVVQARWRARQGRCARSPKARWSSRRATCRS